MTKLWVTSRFRVQTYSLSFVAFNVVSVESLGAATFNIKDQQTGEYTMVTLYHYLSSHKWKTVQETGFLQPTGPFNSGISSQEWGEYSIQFPFPVSEKNTFCFLEQNPPSWHEYGLFDLLMKEFSGGDKVLELNVDSSFMAPLLIRDHSFHSPKMYGCSPGEWQKREVRNSRPDLREKWCRSTIPLSQYAGNFICPEVLVPFPVPLDKIKLQKI